MSFHYVLQSNVAPDVFPKNNAASFSTPLDNPIILEGSWEMAVMSLTHSTRVFPFNNDQCKIHKSHIDFETLKEPINIYLGAPPTHDLYGVYKYIYEEFPKKTHGLVEMSYMNYRIKLRLSTRSVFAVMSSDLWNLLRSDTDVLTQWDSLPQSEWRNGDRIEFDDNGDYYFTVVPFSYPHEEIVLKEAGEVITKKELIERAASRLDKKKAEIALHYKKFISIYLNSHETMMILSEGFHKALQHNQAGMFRVRTLQRDASLGNMSSKWIVNLYPLNDVRVFANTLPKIISLPRQQIDKKSDIISYLKDKFKDYSIDFTLTNEERLQIEIKDKTLSLEMDDAVRDIFAFDTNMLKGGEKFTASDVLSLTRRIRYLYIYSNIGDMVRIGNTEAPLLTLLPYQHDAATRIREKTFKTPMYVPIARTHISQIDIGIYDDAGAIIPFSKGSITSLRLHFRRRQL